MLEPLIRRNLTRCAGGFKNNNNKKSGSLFISRPMLSRLLRMSRMSWPRQDILITPVIRTTSPPLILSVLVATLLGELLRDVLGIPGKEHSASRAGYS